MTRATLRYNQASPSKVRLVLDMIRGLDVSEAREILRFSERGASEEVGKLLDSAIANAEHNDHIASDELFVSAAWADEGPTVKRFRPRARGRGTRILKRTSHITVVVERYSDDDLRARSEREAASGAGTAADRRRRLSRGRRVAASEARREREAARAADHDHDHDEDVDAEETVTETGTGELVADDGDTAMGVEAVTDTEVAAIDESDDASDDDGSEDPSKGAN